MTRQDLPSELVERIADVTRPHPVRVAIDGVNAAGKTALADELVEPLGRAGRFVIRASIDGFHHPATVRYRRGRWSPESYFRDSFNHAQLIETLLAPLGPGGSRADRGAIFDFRLDQPVEAPVEEASPDPVLLFDGVFLLRPELRPYWDFSIFVRADFEVTVTRAGARDDYQFGSTEPVRQRYAERARPATVPGRGATRATRLGRRGEHRCRAPEARRSLTPASDAGRPRPAARASRPGPGARARRKPGAPAVTATDAWAQAGLGPRRVSDAHRGVPTARWAVLVVLALLAQRMGS